MNTVKPETDEEHLRLRARWVVWLRRANGQPVRREDLDRIVIRGGKGTVASTRTVTPSAA